MIETSGFPASSAMCLDLVRKEGKVAHIGWANDLPPLPVIPIMAKTLTVFGIGGNGGRGQYERGQELVRTGGSTSNRGHPPVLPRRRGRGVRGRGVQVRRRDQGGRGALGWPRG